MRSAPFALIAPFALVGLIILASPIAADLKCGGEEKTIPDSFVNDDFCDCVVEGNDEPRTGACATQAFICENKPHAPLSVPASRVSDGICDCCDGSDEASGIAVKCENTCHAAAAAARAAMEAEIKTLEAGMQTRLARETEGKDAQQKRLTAVTEADGKIAALEQAKSDAQAKKATEEAAEAADALARKELAEMSELPAALRLDAFTKDEVLQILPRALLAAKDSTAVEEATKQLTGKNTDECEVDDVEALSIAIEEKDAPAPPVIPEAGAFTQISAPVFDGCTIELHKSAALDAHKVEFSLGEHELDWDDYLAVRVTPNCMLSISEQPSAVTEANHVLQLQSGDTVLDPWKGAGRPKYVTVAASAPACVSWRQRGGCSADGEAEPNNDKSCDATIDSGISGFCECVGSVRTAQSSCEARDSFTCKDKCAAAMPMTSEQLASANADAAKAAAEAREAAIIKVNELESNSTQRLARLAVSLCLQSHADAVLHSLVVKASITAPKTFDSFVQLASATGSSRAEPITLDAPAASAAMEAIRQPYKRAEAESARADLKKVEDEISEVQRAKTDATKLVALEADFGADQEYAAMYNSEISKQVGQYTYKVKLFEDAKQDYQSLGSYKGWKDGIIGGTQMFSGGSSCAGKSREALVILRCGPVDEILDVREDEMCVYSIWMQTPSKCSTARLNELLAALANGHQEL